MTELLCCFLIQEKKPLLVLFIEQTKRIIRGENLIIQTMTVTFMSLFLKQAAFQNKILQFLLHFAASNKI